MIPSTRSRDVVCPFYKSHDGRRIKCEGYTEGMTSMNLNYERPLYINYHMKIHCCACYRECEIYRLVSRVKYLEDEG